MRGVVITELRSNRARLPTQRGGESRDQENLVFQVKINKSILLEEQFRLQEKMCIPIAFVSSFDPYLMCVDQAMKEPNHLKSWEAMQDEVSSHFENGNISLFPCKNIPEGMKVLTLVW